MPYECVAFLNWIRFCNGNANNKAIFVVVIGVSHNIHMIGHCNSKRKERKKKMNQRQIKRIYCGHWTVNWGRLSFVRLWLWPLNDRFGLTEWYFFVVTLLRQCFHVAYTFPIFIVVHMSGFVYFSQFNEIFQPGDSSRISLHTEHYVGFSGIEHFRWSFG